MVCCPQSTATDRANLPTKSAAAGLIRLCRTRVAGMASIRVCYEKDCVDKLTGRDDDHHEAHKTEQKGQVPVDMLVQLPRAKAQRKVKVCPRDLT